MTQTTRTNIATGISTRLADNTVGGISAQDHRDTSADIIDSTVLRSNGSGAPATTPEAIGDLYVDTASQSFYISVGTSSSSDWQVLGAATSSDALTFNGEVLTFN